MLAHATFGAGSTYAKRRGPGPRRRPAAVEPRGSATAGGGPSTSWPRSFAARFRACPQRYADANEIARSVTKFFALIAGSFPGRVDRLRTCERLHRDRGASSPAFLQAPLIRSATMGSWIRRRSPGRQWPQSRRRRWGHQRLRGRRPLIHLASSARSALCAAGSAAGSRASAR